MKELCENINFSDAEYLSCETKDGNLIIFLNSWNDKLIKLEFTDAIQFCYKLGDGVSGIGEHLIITDFLKDALGRCYSKIPEMFPYKHFAVKDIQGFPFFEVIATGIVGAKSHT